MYGLTYRLKKKNVKNMTRRAFSVYRSNTLARFSPGDTARGSRGLASTQNAMFQRQNPVTTRGERQIVRGDERRQLVRAVQPFQQLEHGPSILLVQISGRFICQQHARPCDERPGNRNTLLFPARKFSRTVFGPVLQPNFRQPLARRFQRDWLCFSAHQQRHRDMLYGRKIRQQLMPLPEKPHGSSAKFRPSRGFIRFNRFVPTVYCTARWSV